MTGSNVQDERSVEGDWRRSPAPELSPIMAAALDAFSENGYHGTAVRDIARRVGVTVPALYYHHESKESILLALLDTAVAHLARSCDAAVAEAGDDTADRFFNLVEAIVLYMASSTKLAAMDAEIRSLNPDNRAAYSKARRRIEDELVDAVQAGDAAGLFDVTSPKDTARALLGMFQAIATWYRPSGPVSPQVLAGRYVDIAAHTVGASARLVRRIRAASAV